MTVSGDDQRARGASRTSGARTGCRCSGRSGCSRTGGTSRSPRSATRWCRAPHACDRGRAPRLEVGQQPTGETDTAPRRVDPHAFDLGRRGVDAEHTAAPDHVAVGPDDHERAVWGDHRLGVARGADRRRDRSRSRSGRRARRSTEPSPTGHRPHSDRPRRTSPWRHAAIARRSPAPSASAGALPRPERLDQTRGDLLGPTIEPLPLPPPPRGEPDDPLASVGGVAAEREPGGRARAGGAAG